VEQHLLPRLNGFEILMASYAVAHLKLDMLLSETGYQHQSDKRLRVYLTNSLEESNNEPRTLFAQWLSREAAEANVIKRDCPVMVVIGNPPYSGESQNKGKWIMSLMEDYKKEPGGKMPLDERNPKWLNDDYVKFIRLAQHYIEKKGEGIIGFINPHGYLDNPTFRGMRWNLLKTFDKIYTIDLHGNSKKKETCPDGNKDENVFDIMQGVSINLFVKTGKKDKDELGKVYHKDLYGLRQQKYDFLDEASLDNIGYVELTPQSPMYFFVPKNFCLQEEYDKGFKVDDLFSQNSMGVTTGHDKEVVSFHPFDTDSNVEYYYRPFDKVWLDYDLSKVVRPREAIMKNMRKENISLCLIKVNSSVDGLFKVLVTSGITDKTLLSSKDNTNIFPLYIYHVNMGQEERIVNFNKEMYDKIAKGLNYLPCYEDNVLVDPISDYNGVLYPQDLFDYIYAVLHSPSYRERYKEFLKIDFPRILYPTDWEQFRDLAELGEELRQLHLMEDLPSKTGVTFPVAGSLQVDCYRWQDNRVYINAEQYFEGVPESAWNAFIGGYQPAQKWLKDRKGMTLSFEDVKHYGRIIYVLQQTERLMGEIDNLMKE
jgi:predicted helicase